MTLTLLAIGILGTVSTIRSNYRASFDVGNQDQAHFALETAIATLRSVNFSALRSLYQDKPLKVLCRMGGTPQMIDVQVHFDTNETALPAAYGPVADLDGDGALSTTDVSARYSLLPARLTVTYGTSYGTETRTMYLVLAP